MDRDGVLNEPVVRNGKPYPPAGLDTFTLLPGVVEACDRLAEAGFIQVVVTNQPDVARGTQDRSIVDAMHQVLRSALPIDAIYVCVHDGMDGCDCRKPSPGMLIQAATDFGLDLRRSFMVGDRWRDVEAGQEAGCRTIFIDRGYSEQHPIHPDVVVPDFPAAVAWITASAPPSPGLSC